MSATRRASRPVQVPFLDLDPSHRPIKSAVMAEISDLVDSGAFTNGPQVAEFEREFAAYCGAADCVSVASGLDALRLGLLSCGIEEGDEVLVPANTFVATAEAVSQAGGVPVLVDVTEDDYNIDPDAAEAAITARTRLVLPVHLYGQMADMRRLAELAERHDLRIVEDACQAHGAKRDGVRAGELGAAAAYSFYPGKNLGAMGDAGALTTDDADIAAMTRALREHGQTAKYRHDHRGWTARLDTIQAIVLRHKLAHLDAWNEERRAAATYYLDALDEIEGVRVPPVAPESEPVWHLFVIRVDDPVALASALGERGIATGRHYPEPIHLTRAYADPRRPEGSFPVSEALARECLSLPIFPGMTQEQLDAVATAVADSFRG